MNRIAAVVLTLVLCAVLLYGCGSISGSLPDEISSNDITTMTPVSRNKMTVSIRAEYNVNNEAIRKALAEKFPDINFISVFHCSQQTQYELMQSLSGGTAEDIIISPNMKAVSGTASGYLLDLSACDFVDRYKGNALEECQLNGKLYYLPGPSSVYGIVYDKTMFRKHGWKIPKSYTQFISLVKKIDASGIRAIQPTCVYPRQAQLVLTMFSYQNQFSGVDNAVWLENYQTGKSRMSGHMDGVLKRYRELNRAGVIKASDFQMQPGNRSTMMYKDHTCAMIIETEQAERYAEQMNSDHEYGMFPFWSADSQDADYLMTSPNYYIGINKSLENNSKKLQAVKKAVDYLSSAEGQEAVNGKDSNLLSNIRGVKYEKTSFNAGIMSTVKKGNLVREVDFMNSGNANPVEKELCLDLPQYLSSKMSARALMADCDKVRNETLSKGIDKGELIGKAQKTFSVAETANFIAAALKNKAGADIGLCYAGNIHRGMVGRIYKGNIYAADVSSLSLSVGVAGTDPNDKKLWLVSMTGSQIRSLLEEGYKYDPNDGVPNIPYYVASGLKITFAPWRDEKIVSVKMTDGSSLQNDKTYKVALWGWPFEKKCAGKLLKTYDETSEQIISAAIKKAGTVAPADKKEFIIDYDY
ncbi:MAG: extracellular solute-binding protein [Eubacteriaceae bacterium]|jgi:ABC-type glycerol-3-phosphate transport system substrate-binding protein|nr:extracellular solute-binding protein [Eubacteriaceae bacterium]